MPGEESSNDDKAAADLCKQVASSKRRPNVEAVDAAADGAPKAKKTKTEHHKSNKSKQRRDDSEAVILFGHILLHHLKETKPDTYGKAKRMVQECVVLGRTSPCEHGGDENSLCHKITGQFRDMVSPSDWMYAQECIGELMALLASEHDDDDKNKENVTKKTTTGTASEGASFSIANPPPRRSSAVDEKQHEHRLSLLEQEEEEQNKRQRDLVSFVDE